MDIDFWELKFSFNFFFILFYSVPLEKFYFSYKVTYDIFTLALFIYVFRQPS